MTEEPNFERRAAHERLATGALARWARACATHPWRVVIAWIGIVALLIVLVGAIGGSLKDEFEIPGSDTQKATDLIESEFAAEQGGVLNLVFAAPEGETLDTPERRAAIEDAVAELQTDEFAPTGTIRKARRGSRASAIRSARRLSPTTAASPTRRRSSTGSSTKRTARRSSPSRMPSAQTVEPAGVTVEFNGDAEFPPIEQGTQELLGLLAALIVLLIVFRTFVATMMPIALALTHSSPRSSCSSSSPASPTSTRSRRCSFSMIGLGVGIDYSLFIVTRFRQLLHEGLSPRRRRFRGRRLGGPRRALRRRDGRDLGDRPRVLRPRLRDQARDRLRARRPHNGPDRKLAAHRRACEARAQDRPAEGAVPAPDRRLRGGPREDADRALGAVRDRARAGGVLVVLLVLLALAATSLLVRLGASDQGTQPEEQTARRAYDLLAEGFGPGFNGPIPIVVDVNDDPEAPQRIYEGVQNLEGVASAREPQFNDEETVAIVFVTPDSAPQDEATRRARRPPARRRRPGGDRGRGRSRLRLGPDCGLQGHRRADHGAAAALPALHHRRHVHRARDGVQVDRHLADGGDHDDPVGVRRLRRPHAGGAGGLPDGPHRPRPDRADRDVRARRSPSRSSSGSRWTTWSS